MCKKASLKRRCDRLGSKEREKKKIVSWINLVKEVRKSIILLPTHLMKNKQATYLAWPPCVCVLGGAGYQRNGVSKSAVWRSSVCFVDNWDLELENMGSRWCVGFSIFVCDSVFVCVSVWVLSMWTGMGLRALYVCVGVVSLVKVSFWLESMVSVGTASLCGQSLGWSLISNGLTSGPSAIMMTDVSKDWLYICFWACLCWQRVSWARHLV